MTLTPGTLLGRYEILELVGSGGMGEVYRARDPRLGRVVAVKTIQSFAGSVATQRFLVEARAAAALSHPNVAQVYDAGECAGLPYIAMEYVEGESLESRLASSPMPLAQLVSFGLALAHALGEAHRRSIVHRDVKPSNIVITPEGQPKLLDFGIAQFRPGGVASESLTQTGTILGTVDYMSPEQAGGDPVGPASDIFSLGVVLYRLAAGVPPFSGPAPAAVLYQVVNANPPPLSKFRPDVPLELQRVIHRCLEKSPAARFAGGTELAAALARIDVRTAEGQAQPIPIAVLPFEDLSPQGDNAYFSAGLTEEITVALSGLASLAVVSRTSASRYQASGKDLRTIAAELRVRYVLEGTVRKSGEAVRITAELVDADQDTRLWVGKYRGTLQDVFEIQEEVARQIVEALRIRLTPAERVGLAKRPTLDAEAFDLYLRGRHFLGAATRHDLQQALALFQQALERDPRYAAASAGVAETCAAYYEYFERSEPWLDRAIDSALKALVYDADLPEAFAALGLAYFNKGSLEDSLAACRRAIELDPTNYLGYWILGRIDYVTGRADEAIAMLEKVIELNPDFYPAYFTLRMVCQATGRAARYRPHLMRLVNEILPLYLVRHPEDVRARNCFGTELTEAGRSEEGLVEVERALAESKGDPLILYAGACYFARFGDRARAIELLRAALASGFANFAYLAQDPDLRPLHGDPQYEGLVGGASR